MVEQVQTPLRCAVYTAARAAADRWPTGPARDVTPLLSLELRTAAHHSALRRLVGGDGGHSKRLNRGMVGGVTHVAQRLDLQT
jgi:hypothetical protein